MALWDTTLSAVGVAQTTGIDVEKSPYELKPGPYSSHTLALRMLPEKGQGRYIERPPFSPVHVANSTWKLQTAANAVRRSGVTP